MPTGNNPRGQLPPFPESPKQPDVVGKKTLAAIVGSTVAAAALFVMVPQEESGGRVHLKAYRDIVGVWTICDGDTKNVRPGMVETKEGCERRLEAQLIAHAEPIIRCVPGLKGRENQVVASVSLAYNIGTAGFCRSTVAAHFRAGRWRQGCDRFLAFNKAGGRVIRGLDNRRRREHAVCIRGL